MSKGGGKKSAGRSGKRQPSKEEEEENGMDIDEDAQVEELLALEKDGDHEPSNMIGLCQQDPKERRHIRQEYRKLITDTQKNQHEYIQPESTALHEHLETANMLFSKVKMTREAAIDAQLVAIVANMAKQRAQTLHTDLVVFEPLEFAQKLTTFLSGNALPDTETVSKVTPDGWNLLGAAVQPFFNRAPPLRLMYGSFEAGPPKPRAQRAANVARDKDNIKGAATVVKQLKSAADTDKHEATTEEVESLHQLLLKLYNEFERRPLCYFEFVINPTSFGQTIENMFYSSFLVRDGYARIYLDEDKLPVIEPIEKVPGQEQQSTQNRHQVVMSMSQQEWQDIIDNFNIKTPLIPTRKSRDGGATQSINFIRDNNVKGKSGKNHKAKHSKECNNKNNNDDDDMET